MNFSKLNKFEAVFLVVNIIIAHVILNLPKDLFDNTGIATPINVIYISIIAILVVLLICRLFKRFSNSDILDISKFLAGNWLKLLLGLIYIIYLVLLSGELLRNCSENLEIIYFQDISKMYTTLFFVVAIIVANLVDFKALAKVNLIITILVLISMLIIFASVINLFSIENVLPILGYGFKETFVTGIENIFAFSGILLLFFLPPSLKSKDDFKKVSVISIIFSSIYLLLSVTSLLFTFSSVLNIEFISPMYLLTRSVEYGRFFQRADALFILFWVLSLMSYLSIVLSYILYIFKKITNIKNSKAMTYCFAALLFASSLISRTFIEFKLISQILKYVELILIFIISIGILVFANIKWKRLNLEEKEGEFIENNN